MYEFIRVAVLIALCRPAMIYLQAFVTPDLRANIGRIPTAKRKTAVYNGVIYLYVPNVQIINNFSSGKFNFQSVSGPPKI